LTESLKEFGKYKTDYLSNHIKAD